MAPLERCRCVQYIVVDRYFVKTLLLKIGVGVEALPVLTGITRTTS